MKIRETPVINWIEELASKRPAPGGGSAAALGASMAAALVAKVGCLTQDRTAQEIGVEAEKLARRLVELADEDTETFLQYIKAPQTEKPGLLKLAALVPLETASEGYKVLNLAEKIVSVANPRTITDVGVAALYAEAAVEAAALNVLINLSEIEDAVLARNMRDKLALFSEVHQKKELVLARVKDKISI